MANEVTRLPAWPARAVDGNKGTYGRMLIIAGSRGMSGAAVLAGSACLRAGAGLVRVATPSEAQPLVAVSHPCLMTVPLPHDGEGRCAAECLDVWRRLATENDVVALGPGLGRSDALDAIVPEFVAGLDRPLVLDADGLNACVGRFPRPRGPVVITPHPGEFARLVGLTVAEVQAERRRLAVDFAIQAGVIVVLKGHRTVVTDGRRVYENTTGNPGMATAGSGDVLTGILVALLGQGFEPFDAAQLGVYLHGMAGDLGRDAKGEVSLIATDLIDFLSDAIRSARQA